MRHVPLAGDQEGHRGLGSPARDLVGHTLATGSVSRRARALRRPPGAAGQRARPALVWREALRDHRAAGRRPPRRAVSFRSGDHPPPLLSRPHLRIARHEGAPFVEDLCSHNGTWLAGARLVAPLPIGEGLDLTLGFEISCALRVEYGGVSLTIAGERSLLPLGPLVLPGLRLISEEREGERVVSLELEGGARAALNGALMTSRVDLSMGDAVQVFAPRPGMLRVVG
jgi:hypothetical protein